MDGRGYKAYKEIGGQWSFQSFSLTIDHVQGDPFAAPSRVRVRLPAQVAGFPVEVCDPVARATGVACLLSRRFSGEAGRIRGSGSGKSGQIRIESTEQKVIPTTAIRIESSGDLEARFTVGLPARGRTILGRQAAELLCDAVPSLIARTLTSGAYDEEKLHLHAEVNEDAEALRAALASKGLVAFVADGSVLPRRSGVDDRPLRGDGVVPFRSPASLRVSLEAPNAGWVAGMGIRRGVTLIVGGGYHGKSTLLRAVQSGIYNHRPGDGREQVVSDPAAVKIRAEDGRSVRRVDISAFIQGLPGGSDTRRFSTDNASGSTSQAATIIEALEAGARLLLIDEDTAATNFMIRDRRMQALVPRDREPITPLIDRIGELHTEKGVSSLLALGGSGDYLDVADTVIAMTRYEAEDISDRAHQVALDFPTGRIAEVPGGVEVQGRRVPLADSLDPSRGRRSVHLKAHGRDEILFGTTPIDLSAVEQVVSWAQAGTLAQALLLARNEFMDGKRSIPEILDGVMEAVEESGLDILSDRFPGDLVAFRRFELAAALNRLRTLKVR